MGRCRRRPCAQRHCWSTNKHVPVPEKGLHYSTQLPAWLARQLATLARDSKHLYVFIMPYYNVVINFCTLLQNDTDNLSIAIIFTTVIQKAEAVQYCLEVVARYLRLRASCLRAHAWPGRLITVMPVFLCCSFGGASQVFSRRLQYANIHTMISCLNALSRVVPPCLELACSVEAKRRPRLHSAESDGSLFRRPAGPSSGEWRPKGSRKTVPIACKFNKSYLFYYWEKDLVSGARAPSFLPRRRITVCQQRTCQPPRAGARVLCVLQDRTCQRRVLAAIVPCG